MLADGVALSDPERAAFAGMQAGWVAQQRSRLLNDVTISGRGRLVARFAEFTNEYPWRWRAQDVEAFTTTLRSDGAAHSTIRGYHHILGLFVAFVCDPRYGWGRGVRGALRLRTGIDLPRVEHRGACQRV